MATATRKCANCKERKRTKGGIIKGISFYCDVECMVSYGMKNKHKPADKKHKAKKKVFNDNDTKHQHKLTQAVFNKLRVLEEKLWFTSRGLEPECISCGKTNMDWCCGHFKTRGSQGNLRYDRKNTYLQCNRYCNMGLSGNISGNKSTRGYIQGLHDRFGDEAEAIIEYCENNTEVKSFTGEELGQTRKEFSKQLKALV